MRNVVHLGAGGEAVRLEVSNAFGERPLHVGAMSVAIRRAGGAIDAATRQEVRFSGRRDIVLPEGAHAVSDPVHLSVDAGTDLAVSIYLPQPTGPTTWHQNAEATSYVSTNGNHTDDADDSAFSEIGSWFYLSEVAVRGSDSNGAVIAFGDSISEGYRSTTDANHRYPDFLNERLREEPPGRRLTALNQGIGGNRLLTNSMGTVRTHESAQTRFVRDVVATTGAESVIALFGTNDLASYGGNADGEPATVDDLIRGMRNLIAQAHAHDMPIMVGTIPPFGGSAIYSERTERVRQDYNTWVRESGAPDAVADLDAVLRDPDEPVRMRADLDSGDHVHPSDAGNEAIANSIDIRWLQGPDTSGPEPSDGYLVVGGMSATQPLRGGEVEQVSVPLTNALTQPTDVTVALEVPPGWSSEAVDTTLEPGTDVTVEIPVTVPSAPSTATLTATADAGSALVLGQPTLNVASAPSPSVAEVALDSGGPDSPVLTGYHRLAPDDSYTEDGFGWVEGTPDWGDRGTGDDLRRDFTRSDEPATLRVHIPAGQHDVHVLTGDASYAAGRLVVSEDSTVLADTGAKLPAGQFQWLTFSLDGGSAGRSTDLTFDVDSDGTWRVNALAVLN